MYGFSFCGWHYLEITVVVRRECIVYVSRKWIVYWKMWEFDRTTLHYREYDHRYLRVIALDASGGNSQHDSPQNKYHQIISITLWLL